MRIDNEVRTIPLKRLISAIESGVSVNAVDTPADDGQLGVLKTSCVYTGRFDSVENKAVVDEDMHRVACPVRANTLVVSRMNTPDLVGAAGLVTEDEPNIYLPDRLWQVHFDLQAAVPGFVYWWTQSALYRDQVKMACAGTSSSMQNLDQASFRSFAVPQLPLYTQARIANFLDEQTARIDALIAEKERLVESLAELMASHLEEAFTGARIEGTRKKTGSIFFSELPVSWEPSALKHLLATPVADGPHETPEFVPNGVPFISAEAIKRGLVDFDRKRGYITPELHAFYCQKIKPQRDDIFMVKSGNTTGAVAIVETDDEFSVWSPLAVIRTTHSKILPRFLYLAMQTPYFQRSVQYYWSQGTQPNIGMAVIENLQVAVPPLLEQLAIVERVSVLRDRVEGLKTHCTEHVSRLREYRSSLISAAVTGQLDVSAFKDSMLEAA